MLAPALVALAVLLPTHASVISTNPADGSTLESVDAPISVTVSEDILTVEGAESANALRITDASGAFYGDGCATIDGDTIAMPAQLGAAGDYTLTYQVVSADGHTIDGQVGFTWAPGEGEELVEGFAEAPVCGEAEPTPLTAAPSGAPETSAAAEAPATEAPATEAPATDPADDEPSATPEDETIQEEQSPALFILVGAAAVAAIIGVGVWVARRGRRSEP